MNTTYHKIETLYERGPNFKVIPGQFKNRVYATVNPWHWTEKIDGTNIRAIYAPAYKRYHHDGGNEHYDEYPAEVKFNGRTDNANMPGRLLTWLQQNITVEKMAAKFQSSVVLYGEGYGAGIQQGGGLVANDEQKFILFDVLVDGRWWLNYEQVCDVATSLALDVVPNYGVMTIEEATELVRSGFFSRVGQWAGKQTTAEGLVGRPIETLFDKKGARLIVKLKTKDF